MIQELQLRVLPEQAASNDNIKQYIGREKGLDVRTIKAIRILKRSIDARQRTIFINLKVRVFINELPEEEAFTSIQYRDVSDRPAVIVSGMRLEIPAAERGAWDEASKKRPLWLLQLISEDRGI